MVFANKLVYAIPIIVDFLDVSCHDANHHDCADEGNQSGCHLPVIAVFKKKMIILKQRDSKSICTY